MNEKNVLHLVKRLHKRHDRSDTINDVKVFQKMVTDELKNRPKSSLLLPITSGDSLLLEKAEAYKRYLKERGNR